MKKRRKFLALVLAAAVSVSAGACGSSDSGKDTKDDGAGDANVQQTADVIAAAQKNIGEITSLNAKMITEMDMDIDAGGQKQSMQTVTTADMSCFYDPIRIKMDMSMDAGEMGTTDMEMYMEADEDGTCTMYMYDGTNWQTQSIEMSGLEKYDAAAQMNEYLKDEYDLEETGEEQVEGVDTYKYEGAMTGDGLQEAMLSSGMLDSLSSLGMDSSQLVTMLDGIGEIPITFWIDQSTLYPVKFETDMTSAMNALMSNMMESMGDEAGDAAINVSKVKMSMVCSDYNKAEEFTIPEEAKAAGQPADSSDL